MTLSPLHVWFLSQVIALAPAAIAAFRSAPVPMLGCWLVLVADWQEPAFFPQEANSYGMFILLPIRRWPIGQQFSGRALCTCRGRHHLGGCRGATACSAVADGRVHVLVLTAGWRPPTSCKMAWLEDIEIVLTTHLHGMPCSNVSIGWQPCVRARCREQQGGEGIWGSQALSPKSGRRPTTQP